MIPRDLTIKTILGFWVGSILLCGATAVLPALAVPSLDGTQIRSDLLEKPKPDSAQNPQNSQSIERLSRIIKANPKDTSAYFERALCFSHLEKRDDAIRDLTLAINLDPTFGDALLLRSEMYLLTTDYTHALADANRAIALFPDWCYAYGERARLYTSRERYHDALKDALKALSIDPRDGRVLYDLSIAYDELGDHQKAIDIATLAIANMRVDDPDQLYFSLHERGALYIHAHQFSEADKDLQDALARNRSDFQAWHYLSWSYAVQGRMSEALDATTKALSLELFPPRGYRCRAEMYRNAGEWASAVENYNKAISLEPGYAPSYYQRALAELGLGKLDDCARDFSSAAKINPDLAAAIGYRGLIEDLSGDSVKATQSLEAAFTLTPDLPINFVNRARVAFHDGKFSEALADSNAAITHDPYLADAYQIRGLILDQIGRSAQAENDKQKAKSMGWRNWQLALTPISNSATAGEMGQVELTAPACDPIKPKEIVFRTPELSPQKQWVIACGDIWTDSLGEGPRTQRGYDALSVFIRSPSNMSEVKQLLSHWHISDRASLLKVLSALDQGGGARSEFSELGARVSKMSASELQRFKSDPLNYADSLKADVALKYYSKLGSKSIVAFDYVRYVDFCRLAFCCGYMTEDECWQQIMPVARKLQSSFDSWDDMAADFVAGWQFFYSGATRDQKAFDDALHILQTDPSSPWKLLPWKLENL